MYTKDSNSVNTVSTLGTAGTQLQKAPFLNKETNDVIHTGIKMYWDTPNNSSILDGYL